MLDIVILNYNDFETTINHLNNITGFDAIDHVVVVDNKSTNDSYQKLLKYAGPKVIVVQSDRNGGYGYGNNFGINYLKKHFSSKYIAIANPDVIYTNQCLEKCVSFLKENEEEGYVVVAPQMKDTNGVDSFCIWDVPSWKDYCLFPLRFIGKRHKLHIPQTRNKAGEFEYIDCGCVAGSFFVINIERFGDDEPFDDNIFLYCEETVLGLKIREKKLKSALIINESFVHAHSVSISKSIKSSYRQSKIMWKSRLYVLKTYYSLTWPKQVFCVIISKICLLEKLISQVK